MIRTALILTALVVTSCAPSLPVAPESPSQRNVVVIVIDTLRADHLGCYGYSRDTSPTLDRLAAEGLRYERAFSASTYTRESVASLWTGRLPSSAGHGWRARPSASHPNLATAFREQGYATVFVSDHPALRSPSYAEDRGWDVVHHVSERYYSGRSDTTVQRAINLLKSRADGPFLLYLHLLDPHAPYRPSSGSVEALFPGENTSGSGFLEVRQSLPDLKREGFAPGHPDFEAMVRRYDAEIRDVDDAIADLIDTLTQAGYADHTTFVITSDHGEEFLEHGFVDHSWTLFREVTHVPLIVWGPGTRRPCNRAGTGQSPRCLPHAALPAREPDTRRP